MRSNPKDWRIDQVETIAKRFGVDVRKTKGSHVVDRRLLCVADIKLDMVSTIYWKSV